MKAVIAILLAASALLVSCSRDPNVVKKRYLDNGNKYFDRGKYREASIMYRNALSKDALWGPAHYKLGLTQLKLGQIPQAVGSLRRAVERIPASEADHWDAAVRLADLYVAVTRDKQYLDEADAIAKELLQRDPSSFDGHRLTADLAFVAARQSFSASDRERGQELLKTAIAEYRKADASKPGQANLKMAMARALAASNEFAEAESIYQSVIAKDKTASLAYTELYQLYIWQKKLNEAEQTLKTAVADNPRQYALMTLLASHYYGLHRKDEMVQVLQRMKAGAKDFPQAYLMAGDFYLRAGEPDQAIREYREGMAADAKQKLDYQKRIIEVLIRQGKKAEAAGMNAAILKENPKDPDARGLAASLLLDQGDATRAIAELQSVVSTAPDNFVARFQLGRAHLMRSEFEQARQQFAEAIKLRPDYLQARLALAQLQVAQGQFDPAVRTAQEIIKLAPRNASAQLIEATALMGMKKYGECRQLLQNMAAAAPASADVMFQLGVLNLAENKLKEAEDAFRKAHQLNPANSRALMGVVETYMARKQPDQALQMLQAEANRAPDRTDYRLALANTAVRAGKLELAISEYNAILQKTDPKSRAAGQVHLRLGETYRRKGDLNSSIACLQKAREALPEDSTVVSTLALTLDGAGRRQEARGAYEQTLKLDPANGIALNNLAFLLAESGGDLDQALTYAQRAKQRLPQLREISDTLGWIYLKKNLSDNAIQIFADLVAKEPNVSLYRYHLGMALFQKGDRPRARKELEQALRSNPGKEESAKIRELVAKIG